VTIEIKTDSLEIDWQTDRDLAAAHDPERVTIAKREAKALLLTLEQQKQKAKTDNTASSG